MKKESNVPDQVTVQHVGMRVLYRLPNNAIAIEGVIDELSAEGEYMRVGKRWIPNDGSSVLAVLSGPQRRREGIR